MHHNNKLAGAAKSLRQPIARAKAPKQPVALTSDIRPGQSIELLKELHILTADGTLNQDSRRKLKQVYHLFGFVEKQLLELAAMDAATNPNFDLQNPAPSGLTLADHGAGKSYLGFILYDLFFKAAGKGHVYGVESRGELVSKSRELALRLGFDRMSFLELTVAEAVNTVQMPEHIDIVTALHACDTATDDAIAFGLKKNARAMILVPCCQAEVARALNQNKAFSLKRTPLAELWRHPMHTREIGSQITNVLRCLYLESRGFTVTVTELVGWEHSMKNELIIARRGGRSAHQRLESTERLAALLDQFGLTALRETRFHLGA